MKKILSSFVLLASLSGIVSDSNARVLRLFSSEDEKTIVCQQLQPKEEAKKTSFQKKHAQLYSHLKELQDSIQPPDEKTSSEHKKITINKETQELDPASEQALLTNLQAIQDAAKSLRPDSDQMPGVAALIHNGHITVFFATKSNTQRIIKPLRDAIRETKGADSEQLRSILSNLQKMDLLPANNSMFKDNEDNVKSFKFNTFSHTERQLVGMCLLQMKGSLNNTDDSTGKAASTKDIVTKTTTDPIDYYWEGCIHLDKFPTASKATIYVCLPAAPCSSGDDSIEGGGNLTIEGKDGIYCVDFYKKLADQLQQIHFKVYYNSGGSYPLSQKIIDSLNEYKNLTLTKIARRHGNNLEFEEMI